jgi:hypothetical protein
MDAHAGDANAIVLPLLTRTREMAAAGKLCSHQSEETGPCRERAVRVMMTHGRERFCEAHACARCGDGIMAEGTTLCVDCLNEASHFPRNKRKRDEADDTPAKRATLRDEVLALRARVQQALAPQHAALHEARARLKRARDWVANHKRQLADAEREAAEAARLEQEAAAVLEEAESVYKLF